MAFKVAIVGRPNVGKSSIFNRLIGERKSITHDEAGATRDRIYGQSEWLTKKFNIIDTGGIDVLDMPFLSQIKEQVQIAIDEANLILFVVDGKIGITDGDNYIRNLLYQTNKDVLLVVNKIDDVNQMSNIYEFYELGFGDPIAVSSHHGIGFGDLLDLIISYHQEDVVEYDDNTIKFSLIGRPNVGKSSLTNAILNENRTVVSDIEGTTRDSTDTKFTKDGKDYVVIDTAGIKKRGRIYENLDKYSLLRAESAIERSDICLLLIDGFEGVIEQDKHVASYALENNKAIVIVVNKWDLVLKDTNTMAKMEEKIKEDFKFIPYADIIFLSATEGSRIDKLFPAIDLAYENFTKELKTRVLNDVLDDATSLTPPPLYNKGKALYTYITQTGTKPPTFSIFVNNPNYVHFSYMRYLENQFRKSIDFRGTPIKLNLRRKQDE